VDCRQFDGQVVRLERIKEVAGEFVLVRLTRIDTADIHLFEFDYDITMMIFFLSAEGKVYARYGGRDAKNADNRQSLDGLKYTMQSVLAMHGREQKEFAPRTNESVRVPRTGGKGGGCMHCHQVKEMLTAELKRSGKWAPELAWRYPLPDNLGLVLEVDRGNVVKEVKPRSPAEAAGLRAGDVVQKLGGVPVHSFGDATFALDRAPKTGALDIAFRRGDKVLEDKLALPEGWRRTDLSWRPSMQHLVPTIRVYGTDLTADERKALGLTATQLAFRQKNEVATSAKNAGVRGGDVIVGIDGKTLEMGVDQFLRYVSRNYLVGEQVTLNLLRDGQKMEVTLKLGQ
jgi:predicted metalloprotease with PDZ domain